MTEKDLTDNYNLVVRYDKIYGFRNDNDGMIKYYVVFRVFHSPFNQKYVC